MKKIYLTLILLGLIMGPIFGQICTPDNSITQSGVYPDQPDTAYAGQDYDFSFQILTIKDTAVVFGGTPLTATIDSVIVNDVLGLPASFYYACNPSNCTYTYKAVGCISLKGNPTQSQVGTYDIKIATTAYATAGILKLPVPDTTDGYQLVIKGDGSASIFESNLNAINIYPNPSSDGVFMLHTSVPITSIEIHNVQGKSILFKEENNGSTYSFDLSNTPSGIYLLKMVYDGKQIIKKIIH